MWFEEPASENMLRAPYTETVAPSTISRVDLEIGSKVKIPVFIFKATTEAKVPSLKMYNKMAAERGDPPIVAREVDYVSSEKAEVSLAPEQVIAGACVLYRARCALYLTCACSAYPYGKSVVPMDSAEKATIEARFSCLHARRSPLTSALAPQFKPMPHSEDLSGFKGMQLLGFTDASTLPLYLNLRTADYVLPMPMKGHPSELWKSGGTDATTAARCGPRCVRALTRSC